MDIPTWLHLEACSGMEACAHDGVDNQRTGTPWSFLINTHCSLRSMMGRRVTFLGVTNKCYFPKPHVATYLIGSRAVSILFRASNTPQRINKKIILLFIYLEVSNLRNLYRHRSEQSDRWGPSPLETLWQCTGATKGRAFTRASIVGSNWHNFARKVTMT